jgi:hypothetical protein
MLRRWGRALLQLITAFFGAAEAGIPPTYVGPTDFDGPPPRKRSG